MTYTKPTVGLLGNARELIEHILGKTQSFNDNGVLDNPAYDLDE